MSSSSPEEDYKQFSIHFHDYEVKILLIYLTIQMSEFKFCTYTELPAYNCFFKNQLKYPLLMAFLITDTVFILFVRSVLQGSWKSL